LKENDKYMMKGDGKSRKIRKNRKSLKK